MSLISVQGVEKRYGDFIALRDINLEIAPGCVGLLGPNGAGKSTLLKALLALHPVSRGSVSVFGLEVGRSPYEVRRRIGYMPEGDAVMGDLTALEFTTFAAELCGLPRAEAIARSHQVLYYVGLGEVRYRRLGTFATGMRQRARLAQALVGEPELLLLDEPTSGLDPQGRREMLSLLVDIPRRTGASLLLSTHILPDVEKTCDQVIVLAEGQVRYSGELAPLLNQGAGLYEVRVCRETPRLKEALEAKGLVVTQRGDTLEVRVEGDDPSPILESAVDLGVAVRHLAPLVYSLERAFHKTVRQAAPKAP